MFGLLVLFFGVWHYLCECALIRIVVVVCVCVCLVVKSRTSINVCV